MTSLRRLCGHFALGVVAAAGSAADAIAVMNC